MKDKDGVGAALPTFAAPLHLDVQQNVDAGVQFLLDDLQGGAVVVVDILRVLQKLVPRSSSRTPSGRQSCSSPRSCLSHPGLAGGVGHGEVDPLPLAQQLCDHGALAHAGGTGERSAVPSLSFWSFLILLCFRGSSPLQTVGHSVGLER